MPRLNYLLCGVSNLTLRYNKHRTEHISGNKQRYSIEKKTTSQEKYTEDQEISL